MTRQISMVEPICIECRKLAREVTGADIYPGREDLRDRTMWLCECGAWVGSHSGTDAPLGYPAGRALRDLRSRCHQAFDAIWAAKMRATKWPKGRARNAAYAWLAGELGIEIRDCHFAHFDTVRCTAALKICERVRLHVLDAEMAINRAKREAARS